MSARTEGFSLLELMIALAIGGIAITSMYSIGAASTRTFQSQQQLATAQTALRVAMNQVKRDIARAGYLATPNVEGVGQACGTIDTALDQPAGSGRNAAISAFVNGATSGTGLDTGAFNKANGFTTDDVVLFANYATSDEYPGIQVNNANQITVDPNWQSFNRDFSTWYTTGATGFDQNAFNDAFVAGRMIRIQTTRRGRHFAVITAAPVGTSFTFSQAIPGTCDANGGWVAPVSAIRYYAKYATAANEIERYTSATQSIGQLIREEVLPTDKRTPLAAGATARAVLDYAVRFKLFFNMTNRAGLNPGLPLTKNDFATAVTDPTVVNLNPERIRSVAIELAARAPQVDSGLPWQGSCDGLVNPGRPLCFQVSDTEPGAARVRVLRAEVLVPNVAFEDL